MNGYEYSTGNPYTTRGNGSAHELFNMNPALFGSGAFGTQPNPAFNTPFGSTTQGTQTQQPFTQTTNPYFQQQTNQGWQQQPFHTQWQQQPFNSPWQQQTTPFAQQQTTPFAQPWQTQQPTGNPWTQQQQMQQPNTGVFTTKAVDINLAIPAQTVLGRHPIEIQQYVLQVIVPTLIDALSKRAMAHDVGQSISYDIRGGCVARVGI